MRPIRLVPTILACAATLLGPKPARAAWGTDPVTSSLAICTAANEQFMSKSVSDDAGGAIVVWADFRSGAGDIYAQRITPDGTMAWGSNGIPVCALPFSQQLPDVIPDGAGGAIVAWSDGRSGSDDDLYAQRLDASGAPTWAADGVLVAGGAGHQRNPVLVPDGEGGAIVGWRSGATSVSLWTQRLSPGGALLWTPGGVPLTTATGNLQPLIGAADGTGGAAFTWATYDDLIPGLRFLTIQAVDGLGAVRWGPDGIGVSGNYPSVLHPGICTDGAGGAVIAWLELDGIVLAERFDAAGARRWAPSGAGDTVFVSAVGGTASLSLAADGNGGAYLSWSHGAVGAENIRAQYVDGLGTHMWGAGGVAVCSAAGKQGHDVIRAIGSGGAILAWSDFRTGTADIYAQRLDLGGGRLWSLDGIPVCTAPSAQYFSQLVPSTSNGWIVVWEDYRSGATRDLYAQFVDNFGFLGDPSPNLLTVADVPGDEGGMLQVTWAKSFLDRAVDPLVVQYRLLRQMPDLPGSYRAGSVAVPAWELVATVPAQNLPTYQVTTASKGDDVLGEHPVTTFLVEAHSSPAGTGMAWGSESLGGFSIDNLSPPAPAPFSGTYSDGTTSMLWTASPAGDFDRFRLYRGTSPGFTPGPANLLAETTGTTWADPGGSGWFYRLSAVDTHENESGSTALDLSDVGVPGAGASFALVVPWPHPVRGDCTIRFAVPHDGVARLALYDLAGRRVATLHDGPVAAGPHAAELAIDGARGRRPGNGVYLLRLEFGGRALARRIVIAR